MPPEMLKTLPGYDPDIEKNRAEARQIMQKLGYGPDNPLKIKVSTRDLTIYRDPAVILIDQLKQVYFDGELELIDTSRYFPKIMRKEFTIGLNLQTSGAEAIDLFYACGSSSIGTAIAIKRSTNCSSSNRKPPMRSAANNSYGRSSASWPRTSRGRSSSMAASRPAGSPTSRTSRCR